jgi:cell division protein FtsI (penicillin-binding protein 3)
VIDTRSTRRRLAGTIVCLVVVVGLFGAKLVDIQVVRADELNGQSKGKRSVAVTTYGARGSIVDSNGVVLASSVDRYDITASPRNAGPIFRNDAEVSVEEQLAQLAEATGESIDDLRSVLQKNPEADFAYLSKSATLEVRTAVLALGIPWVYTPVHPSRTYPNGAVAGNLIGFLGTDGAQAGLELAYDGCLAATNGTSTYERSKGGMRLPGSTVVETQPVDGGTLTLTIDSDFSWFVQQTLAKQVKDTRSQWGTAVVVRVSDGALMAVADYPSVDPNDVNGVSNTALGSRAFSTPYEPGSTFKPMTAAMLIDKGKASKTTHVVAPGRIYFPNGEYINDVFAHGDLRLTTAGVLMNSSNTGIALLSDRLSKSTRYDYFTKFGVGKKTDVKFPGQSAGVLPTTDRWDQITNYAVAFGQGVSATSVQLASIYQTLGNDGVQLPLKLVEGCEHADGTMTDVPEQSDGTRVVSKKAANDTLEMLETVTTVGPLASLLNIPNYRVAAKSGTAQVAANGVYTSDRVVSVAGLIPAEDPEYAVVVTLVKPGTIRSSAAAAPAFKKIMTQIIKTFRIEPSTKKAPSIPVTW